MPSIRRRLLAAERPFFHDDMIPICVFSLLYIAIIQPRPVLIAENTLFHQVSKYREIDNASRSICKVYQVNV